MKERRDGNATFQTVLLNSASSRFTPRKRDSWNDLTQWSRHAYCLFSSVLGWTIFYCLFGFVQISDSGCDATADALHCHSLMTLYKTKIITIDLIVFFETISVLNVPLRAMESNPPHSTLVAVAVSNANPSARENRVYSPMKECWSRDDLFTCSERHHSAAAAHRFRPTVCTAALEKGHSDEHSISRGQLTIPLSCSHRPLQRTTAGPSPFFLLCCFYDVFSIFQKKNKLRIKQAN